MCPIIHTYYYYLMQQTHCAQHLSRTLTYNFTLCLTGSIGKSPLMFIISSYYYAKLLLRGYTPIHTASNIGLTPSLTWVSSSNSGNATVKELLKLHARLDPKTVVNDLHSRRHSKAFAEVIVRNFPSMLP